MTDSSQHPPQDPLISKNDVVPTLDPTGESATAESVRPFQRNDAISPVAIVGLILFLLLQSTLPGAVAHYVHPRPASPSATAASVSSDMPSALASGIPEIALQAKQSYLGTDIQNQQDATVRAAVAKGPFARLLAGRSPLQLRRAALATATALLKRYPNQLTVARSVILLRAETGDQNPLALPGLAAPPTAFLRKLPGVQTASQPAKPVDPLAAYNPVRGEPAGRAGTRAAERQILVELFSSKSLLSRDSEARIDRQIRALPQLRWWGKLALRQAAIRSGDASQAARTLAQIKTEAVVSSGGVTLIGLIALAAVITGIICIIVLLSRRFSRDPRPASDDSILAERAPLIADKDRRLGAGDLGNLFFLYLALAMGIEFAVTHAPRDFIHRALLRLPYQQQFTVAVLLTFALTALSGLLTLAAMLLLAKKRGASLALEIGLNLGGRSLLRIALFGFLGWSVSLPLVFAVETAARFVFHGAPDPANPIIPIIMAAPNGVPLLLLYVLAAFLAPLFEETVFRGLFFNAARLRVGTTGAILLTGAAFGLSHPVGIGQQCALATLGAVFAWMAHTKKSLLPGMFAHFYQNTFVFGNLAFSLLGMVRAHTL